MESLPYSSLLPKLKKLSPNIFLNGSSPKSTCQPQLKISRSKKARKTPPPHSASLCLHNGICSSNIILPEPSSKCLTLIGPQLHYLGSLPANLRTACSISKLLHLAKASCKKENVRRNEPPKWRSTISYFL